MAGGVQLVPGQCVRNHSLTTWTVGDGYWGVCKSIKPAYLAFV